MSEPTRMQLEARQYVIDYSGRNSVLKRMKRQAVGDADWRPSSDEARQVLRIRGTEAMTPASSKRLGGAAELAQLVGHQPRRPAFPWAGSTLG